MDGGCTSPEPQGCVRPRRQRQGTAMAASDIPVGPAPGAGTIRYWAAAKAAAGTAEEPYRAATLAEALADARERHARQPEFARVLLRCSFLVDGDPVGT